SHTVTAALQIPHGHADGVVIAQGGRFGGWSVYLGAGRLCYAYNCYGRDLTTVQSRQPLSPGRHEVQVKFAYDGGEPGSGAAVTLYDGAEQVGAGRIEQTTAYYFSFDETLNVGVDRGTPVTDA